MTAAHKILPFGTRVRVKRLDNGRSVDVLSNDCGPYVAGRVIDLSRAAADKIGMTGQGVATPGCQSGVQPTSRSRTADAPAPAICPQTQ
jgi:rare lipoprotein A